MYKTLNNALNIILVFKLFTFTGFALFSNKSTEVILKSLLHI